MNLNNKKIYIAPYTQRTIMFKNELEQKFNISFCGFIDKVQEGGEIERIEDLTKKFDFILILSQNHFHSIYNDYKKQINPLKLLHIDIIDGEYKFYSFLSIFYKNTLLIPSNLKLQFFKLYTKFLDSIDYKRTEILFISKDFISTNNKALYISCNKSLSGVTMATNNFKQYKKLKEAKLSTTWIDSFKFYKQLAKSKFIILDQGNYAYSLKYLTNEQKTIQLWHGVPLKRMNLLVNITYDYLISTSNYVNDTSLNQVIQAKRYLDYGYPRNDLFLKENHSKEDLLFCNKSVYAFVKKSFNTDKNILIYMPTHRNYSIDNKQKNEKKLLPFNLSLLNENLIFSNSFLIIKLHPFILQFYKNTNNNITFSNIIFYESDEDIYPILKYTDILITDYSSIYYDYLLLNKPIIFFDYDKNEYEKNIRGFTYNYDEVTPGEKVQTQEQLILSINDILNNNDRFKEDRQRVKNLFFSYTDENSATRIIDKLLKESL